MNHLWLAKDLAEHPEIAREEIGSPVIIASLPAHRQHQTPPHARRLRDLSDVPVWQVHMSPGYRGSGIASANTVARRPHPYEQWMYRMSPSILTGHPMLTNQQEEDQWLIGGDVPPSVAIRHLRVARGTRSGWANRTRRRCSTTS